MPKYTEETIKHLFKYQGSHRLTKQQREVIQQLEDWTAQLADNVRQVVPENDERTRGLNGILDGLACLKRAVTHNGKGA